MAAELLLCHQLSIKRIDLYCRAQELVDSKDRLEFFNLIEKRAAGEPLQYLLGKWDFWDFELEVNHQVLIPRPETELIVEHILKLYPSQQEKKTFLDVGTGSGCLAIALAREYPQAQVMAIDKQRSALKVAQKNIIRLNLHKRINLVCAHLLTGLRPEQRFDCIVSNPPYIAESEYAGLSKEVKSEPEAALKAGEDGTTLIAELLENAPRLLNRGGWLLIEHSPWQKEKLAELVKKNCRLSAPEFIKDYHGRHRLLVIARMDT